MHPSIFRLAVEFGHVAFKVEGVEAAGKIGFRLFDVIAAVVAGVDDPFLTIAALLSLNWKLIFCEILYQNYLIRSLATSAAASSSASASATSTGESSATSAISSASVVV